MSQDPRENQPSPPADLPAADSGSDRLRLSDVRAMYRLIIDVREMGSDPQKWRTHMVQQLRNLVRAGIVVSSEVHFRRTPAAGGKGHTMKVIDIGWFSDTDGQTSRIHTEREDESPEVFWLTAAGGHGGNGNPPAAEGELVPVKPSPKIYGGTSFIMSQVGIPHVGAVDQLGLHREFGDKPFTRAEHRLVRLFHVELGRLWRRDVLRRAKEPTSDLPPRLVQTLDELAAGRSEKEIALKLELSRHTIHNYVKALHQRLNVNSRGELLALANKIRRDPKGPFSEPPPPPAAPRGGRRRKSAENSGPGKRV